MKSQKSTPTTNLKAIITTQNYIIKTANDEALYLLQREENDVVGKHIADFIVTEDIYQIGRDTLTQQIMKRRDCLFKAYCYTKDTIWMFGEIILQSCIVILDDRGLIINYDGDGVKSTGKHITKLIPHLQLSSLEHNKYYCGYSDVVFPLLVYRIPPDQFQEYSRIPECMVENPILLKLEWLPNLSGMMTLSMDGIIQQVNSSCCEWMFGVDESTMVGSDIRTWIIGFEEVLAAMRWTFYQDDTMLIQIDNEETTQWCTSSNVKADTMNAKPRTPSHLRPHSVYCTPKACHLFAKHRDSSLVKVSVQCRKSASPDQESLYVLWISFHKDHVDWLSVEMNDCIDAVSSLSINTKEFVMSPAPKSPPLGIPSLHSCTSSTLSHIPPPFPQVLKDSTNHTIEDFEIIDALGEGTFSFIKKCTFRLDPTQVTLSNQTPVVIKYVVRNRILSWCRQGHRIPLEISILKRLHGTKHIPKMEVFFSDLFYYYIVMEYQPAIDLFTFIDQTPDLSMPRLCRIFKQVLYAVQSIHSQGIVHRDIKVCKTNKDENILINDQDHITLIDFGSGAYITDGPFTTFFGTRLWTPPELLLGEKYDGPKQDVWQLGVLLYTFLFKTNPFYSVEDILECQITYLYDLEDHRIKYLLEGLLCKDVNQRLTIQEAIQCLE